jgi:transposase
MRGTDRQTSAVFSYLSPEAFVLPNHPLRAIRPPVNAALDRLSGDFAPMYSAFGRESIAPEKLLRALLLQAFFSVRSERQLIEQLTYNIMFRWFVGLSMDAAVWDVTVFTKNRDRLLDGDIARAFLRAVLADPHVERLLSDEHFSVDGTMIEAYASMKSFQPKDGSGTQANLGATATLISTTRSGATKPMPARLTLTAGCIRKAQARPPNFVIWAMWRWRIVTVSWWPPTLRRRPARPNARRQAEWWMNWVGRLA